MTFRHPDGNGAGFTSLTVSATAVPIVTHSLWMPAEMADTLNRYQWQKNTLYQGPTRTSNITLAQSFESVGTIWGLHRRNSHGVPICIVLTLRISSAERAT